MTPSPTTTPDAIIYYSSTGHAYQMAKAYEEGAKAAGAEVRVRRVQELAPQAAIDQNLRRLNESAAGEFAAGEAASDALVPNRVPV